MGLEGGLATTGKSKEELLQDIYKTLLKRRRETDQDVLDVVTGEGRGVILGIHSFTSAAGVGGETITVTIGETLPGTTYGVLVTRETSLPNNAWNIENRTEKTFDVVFTVTGDSIPSEFSWMVIY